MASEIQQTPFVKQLAANDRPTRDKAVESLRTYLSGRRQFDEIELLKLWKGLFFCMWMSDRPRTQQRLAVDLAGLVDTMHSQNVMHFLDAFWKTLAREWGGIDALRVDKFLHLIRCYLSISFKYLSKMDYRSTFVLAHNEIISQTPLHPTNSKIPNGLRYHVIDIYVDEMDKVDQPRCGMLPLESMLEPLNNLERQSNIRSVKKRAKEALDDKRLADWIESGKEDRVKSSDQTAEGEDEEWDGLDE